MAGESQQVPDAQPDPSVLVTEAITRALVSERDYQDARHEVIAMALATTNQRIEDLQTMLQERYETQTKAVDAALQAQQTAMQTAFAAADKAVDKALEAAEKAVDVRQNASDREFHEHLEQVRHENKLLQENADKATQAALLSQQTAVNKAEQANEKRFEGVNEFRQQLNDQARAFLTRTEYTVAHDALEKTVTELANRFNRTEGHSTGLTSAWQIIIGLGSLIAVAATIIIATR